MDRLTSRATVPLIVLAVMMPVIGWGPSHNVRAGAARQPQQPAGIPPVDVTAIIEQLGLQRLPPPLPVLYHSGTAGADRHARHWQIARLEARSFWRSLLGVAPEGGMIMVDGTGWQALAPSIPHGFPALALRTTTEGVLAVLAAEDTTRFAAMAGQIARIAPAELRGVLLAHRLADPAGAVAYARAWTWVLLAEGLREGLRLEVPRWWQQRIVGAAGAALFLESSPAEEYAPGQGGVLEVWSWFLASYLTPFATELAAMETGIWAGDLRPRLEAEARLLLLGFDLVHHYGLDAFRQLQQAWPEGTEHPDSAAALEALLQHAPLLGPWEERLHAPRDAPPLPPPRRRP